MWKRTKKQTDKKPENAAVFIYLLAGDYFISALTKERVIFFKKDVYTEFYGDPNELYEEVLGVESYRTVTPAWYETALKVKYTRDDISAQIIDLINETATTNFIYAYNFAINGLGNVYRELVTAGSGDYVSTVEKKLSAGETKLNAIIEAFRSKQD